MQSQNLHFHLAKHALQTLIEPNVLVFDEVKQVLLETDRLSFLPAIAHPLAYSDEPILLKKRCELPIYLIAVILQTIYQKIYDKRDLKALVVSAGTGFSTTLLSAFFQNIMAYESDNILYARLLDKVKRLKNVSPVMSMPHDENLFDVIFMDGGARAEIAESVKKALKPRGVLLVVQPESKDHIDENLCISHHNYTKPLRYPLCHLNCYAKNDLQELILDSVVCQTHLPLTFNPQFTFERFVF